jgi:threonine dehydrogenase-like Zn-dependent dehydrogenase
MKALCWLGKEKVRVEEVPDPRILNPKDAILEVTSTAICGSDLHLYGGYIPTMQRGDVLGHEFMGRVIEVGSGVTRVKVGDRVVVPFTIACGACWFCKRQEWSLCDNTNPNATLCARLFGHSPAGLFGYSHLTGGYAGGQAELVRVPFADVGCFPVPDSLGDDQVLFLSDILPTGFMAAENGGIEEGDVVAVWGAGPVGQLAIQSAFLLGASAVIAIDRLAERLALAARHGAWLVDFSKDDVLPRLLDLTGGRGPDVCIEAVGLEAHGSSLDALYDKGAVKVGLETDRAHALRQAIVACRKGGTVSMAGVFGGLVDKIPFGSAFNKSLTLKMGQTHVHRYMPRLLEHIERGALTPDDVITHHVPLEDAADAYALFQHKDDGCIKVVLQTGASSTREQPWTA